MSLLVLSSVFLIVVSLGALFGKSGLFNGYLRKEFLFYFTNASALVCLAVYVSRLVTLVQGVRFVQGLCGACVVYEMVVFVVYNFYLVPSYKGNSKVGKAYTPSDVLMHCILPFAVFADWLFICNHGLVGAFDPLWWLVYPLIYAGFSLLRGKLAVGPKFGYIDSYYPYPFLDLDRLGVKGFVPYFVGFVLVFVLLGYAVFLVDGLLVCFFCGW